MYTFIINPHSRSGKGLQIWNKLQPLIDAKKITYTSHFTNYQGHATKIVSNLTADKQEHTLIILGGDGTINEILNGIHHFDKLKIGLGKLTYLGIALNRLLSSKPSKISITLDAKETLHFENAYFAAIMNHCYEGGGFKFCPDAQPDDDMLNVIVAHKISKLRVLLILPFAFKGLHTRFPGIQTFTCKKVLVESDIALPVHTDGEPIPFQQKISAALTEKQVRLII